ncbi:hypothetical protein JCM8097_004331 [Rhodosporidiobolus ruineniae]
MSSATTEPTASASVGSAPSSGSASASSSAASAQPTILGTTTYNVSADSPSLVYYGTEAPWRSDTNEGYYRAYANTSDAYVRFTFTGVAASYLTTRSPQQGICLISIDERQSYTIDLYSSSTNQTDLGTIFSTPTLPYGVHNLTISQLSRDARLGYYPQLLMAYFTVTTPTDIAAYTRTQVLPASSAVSTVYYSYSSAPNAGVIAGSVIGVAAACALLGFAIYWYRERKRRRKEVAAMEEIKEKPDEPPTPPLLAAAPAPPKGGPYGGAWPPPGIYGDPYAAYRPYPPAGYGYPPHPPANPSSPRAQSDGAWPGPPPSRPALSADSHGQREHYRQLSGPSSQFNPQDEGPFQDPRQGGSGSAYPIHVQGGPNPRSYAVPEL